jgi:diadenosine tetraphosphate (Ap4A) HIT family hydrolase
MKYVHSSKLQVCSICAELSHKADTRLAEALRSNEVSSATGFTSKHFVAIPSVGPLVLGHSLIVTRGHQNSVLLFSNRLGLAAELHELLRVLTSCISSYLECSGYLLFEHASTRNTANLCSTSHAHLHVVPLRSGELLKIENSLAQTSEIVRLDSLADRCRSAEDFVYAVSYSDGQPAKSAFFIPAGDLQSQYMRRQLASALGLEEWDWKRDPRTDVLKNTIELFFTLHAPSEGSIAS